MAQQLGNVALYLSIVNLIYTIGSAILITGVILGMAYEHCWSNPLEDDAPEMYCKSHLECTVTLGVYKCITPDIFLIDKQ